MFRYLSAILFLTISTVAPADDTSLDGTQWVTYSPIQTSGVLKGCQLTYLTVVRDYAYKEGALIAVNGSLMLNGSPSGLHFILKVGLRDVESSSSFERPAFAYVQTAGASTAQVRQESADGDSGYKMFVYNATDPVTTKVLTELFASRSVTIGYSRRMGGIDVLAPLDLTVTDTEYTTNATATHKRSPDALRGFAECNEKLVGNLLDGAK